MAKPYPGQAGNGLHVHISILDKDGKNIFTCDDPEKSEILRHAIGGVPSATLGPYLPSLVADWMAARIADKPMKSERWFVDNTGKVTKTPL